MTNDYCERHEWSANHPLGACPDCAEVARLREEIAALKEALMDVLEISEIEGAVNTTVMESCKLMAARTLLGPESRFHESQEGGAAK